MAHRWNEQNLEKDRDIYYMPWKCVKATRPDLPDTSGFMGRAAKLHAICLGEVRQSELSSETSLDSTMEAIECHQWIYSAIPTDSSLPQVCRMYYNTSHLLPQATSPRGPMLVAESGAGRAGSRQVALVRAMMGGGCWAGECMGDGWLARNAKGRKRQSQHAERKWQ